MLDIRQASHHCSNYHLSIVCLMHYLMSPSWNHRLPLIKRDLGIEDDLSKATQLSIELDSNPEQLDAKVHILNGCIHWINFITMYNDLNPNIITRCHVAYGSYAPQASVYLCRLWMWCNPWLIVLTRIKHGKMQQPNQCQCLFTLQLFLVPWLVPRRSFSQYLGLWRRWLQATLLKKQFFWLWLCG